MEQLSGVVALVNGKQINLYVNKPPKSHSPLREFYVENPNIEIKDSTCEIQGEARIYSIAFSRIFNPTDAHESDIEYRFKNLIDRIRGIKTPSVSGWYRANKMSEYRQLIANFTINVIE